MSARLHHAADRELHETAVFLERQRRGYGERFLAAADEMFRYIAQFPLSGRQGVFGTRHVSIRRFPYQVIYVIESDGVFIIAIPHYRRDETYWHSRIR